MFATNDFKHAMSHFATGVTIVLLQDSDAKLYGMTVNSFNSVSLNPPLVLYSVNKSNKNLQHYLNAKAFSINILSENQQNLSTYFADKNKDLTTFTDYIIENDVPIVHDTLAHLICEPFKQIEAGDHFIIVAKVAKLFCNSDKNSKPLIYFGSEYRELS